jgi:hypothetical protein
LSKNKYLIDKLQIKVYLQVWEKVKKYFGNLGGSAHTLLGSSTALREGAGWGSRQVCNGSGGEWRRFGRNRDSEPASGGDEE